MAQSGIPTFSPSWEELPDPHAFQSVVEDDNLGMTHVSDDPSLLPTSDVEQNTSTEVAAFQGHAQVPNEYVKYLKDEVDTVPIISESEMVFEKPVPENGAERSRILLESEPEPWEPLSKECICGMPVEKDESHDCILLKLSTSEVYEVQCKACLKKIKCLSSAKNHVMWCCPNLKPRFKCHVCDKYLKVKGLCCVQSHLGLNGHGLAEFIRKLYPRSMDVEVPADIRVAINEMPQLWNLIQSYRKWGHRAASIDPLAGDPDYVPGADTDRDDEEEVATPERSRTPRGSDRDDDEQLRHR
ncbi:unnamed protein product [Cyprideis torosa]|uniref:Uncharacterized protein n=1 Tax=Cyprideis torosa TaxID=163714 RepID=A0A7R8W7M0_9CRUS|nr:unnamed protein product [Cyprideis torosa]CAG0887702.1 unnamed protein product [Cyprideis torosa]